MMEKKGAEHVRSVSSKFQTQFDIINFLSTPNYSSMLTNHKPDPKLYCHNGVNQTGFGRCAAVQ